MPEGHSIRRLASAFEQLFLGRRCQVSSPQGRFAAGARLLDGHVMTEVMAHGKHLFLGFGDEPLWLHIHLGLYGAWRFAGPAAGIAAIGAPRKIDPDRAMTGELVEDWQPAQPIGQVRLRLLTSDCVADVTGPNTCEVLGDISSVLGRLGPDPLKNETGDREIFTSAIRSSKRPVGELLLDQKIAAGVGNIFRAEALFRQGIAPGRSGEKVSQKRLNSLWDDLVLLMNRAVLNGHIVTVEPNTEAIDPESEAWYVYHRAGKPCLECNGKVAMKKVHGRTLFWCPRCQR
ncbi:Fpg/Nei family DNA glycosylase [Actinomycetaceae bacterium WB03_NA08]|uniref:DNA-(apurinic or apyrimidinic site) lyase n=1 Tax=Scrofimicrobium canadense TaxID=2652290 RepID=A0A6N7W9A3_9ACTO|nr:DNA glycosylase [Scrofimicrobium canadense]MSS85012.1 Fpg/Nei family DNA glycosylase [Scrofimicrobium canadense]